MEKLESLELEEFKKVVDVAITILCKYNTENIQIYDKFNHFDINRLKDFCVKIIIESDFDADKLRSLIKFESQERVDYFINAIVKQKNKLSEQIINNHYSKYGDLLSDFDWTVNYVLGTSALTSLNYPVANLNFKLENSQENSNSTRTFEVTKEILDDFIGQLEGKLPCFC